MSIEIIQGTTISGTPVTTTTLKLVSSLTGTVNGVNKTFTLASTPVTGTVEINLRECFLEPGDSTNGFSRSGTTITIGTNITAPSTGETFYANYIQA